MKKEKDNKYHWKYEMNLYKNPTILFLLFKIFGCICFGIWLFSTIISIDNVDFWWNGFVDNLKVFVIITIIIFTLCILGYYLYAYIMGGTYNVTFEMDEKGIKHIQEDKQIKKIKTLSILTVLVGLFKKNSTVVGIGLNSSNKTSMYTSFKKISKIKYNPKRNTIILNATGGQNQIYASSDDLKFIYKYILNYSNIKKGK